MAAVYENLSSDLVWQIARTLPTTEIIHNPGGIGDWRYWSRDGMEEGKCCAVLLSCTLLQTDMRRAEGELLQELMRIGILKDLRTNSIFCIYRHPERFPYQA